MRPDIPWNVAGIPPEAREAARAAARREGLSVGEWMTRRILHSFSEASDDMTPAREQWSTTTGGFSPQPEAQPSASRRDTHDMLAHVARSGSENSDIYRRIEEQLRNIARRLESTERNQSENNRALNQAASEINVAARDQAQAFDQLGGSVVSLADRIERVERSAAGGEGAREAIKGLHQGLTRLADQIATTANQSASQIATLAANLEALAGRLAQARTESQAAARGLDDRLTQLDQRVASISSLDERLRAVERNAHTAGDAISQALQSIEKRKDEEAIARRREAETAGAIARLEDNLATLAVRDDDPAIDRRLSAIERSLAEIAGRLDTSSPNGAIEDSIKRLAQRLDAAEGRQRDIESRVDAPAKTDAIEDSVNRLAQRLETAEARQRDQIGELQAAIKDASSRLASVETAPRSFTGGGQALTFGRLSPTPDTQPIGETPPSEAPALPTSGDPIAPTTTPLSAEPAPFNADQSLANPISTGDTLASAPPPVADSFLSAARRSARAAVAQAEAERPNHIGGFRWNAPAAAEETDPAASKKTYIWIGLILLFVVLAVAAGAILSQKINSAAPHSASGLFMKSAAASNEPARPTAGQIPTLAHVAETTGARSAAVAVPASSGRASTGAATKPNTQLIPSGVVKPAVAAPPSAAPSSETVTTIPVTFGPPSVKPQQQVLAPLDRLTQLATAGNARAELVVGLKYLDGDGVPVNEVDAVKWLERAAQQGMPVAQYRLGTIYERGRGVPGDPAKAIHWYQLAAQAGNRKAMHNLAVAYASGAGTTKNLAEAARWFSKAAALGLADSEFNLAVLYERGLGVPQSLIDAYKWYAIAAANGDAESKARIDALATQLSGDDRTAAQRAADGFHAQPLDARANVAPTLNDVAG